MDWKYRIQNAAFQRFGVELSTRCANVLHDQLKVETVEQLRLLFLAHGRGWWLRLGNFGPKSYREIEELAEVAGWASDGASGGLVDYDDFQSPHFYQSPLPLIELGRCELCAFYHRMEGQCRRNPPVAGLGRGWPDASANDMCGEFAHMSRLRIAENPGDGFEGYPRPGAERFRAVFDRSGD